MPCVDGLALEGERRVPGDHEASSESRQVRRQVFRHAIGEVILVRIAAEIGERQHDDRETRRLRAVGPLAWKQPRAYPPASHGREKSQQRHQAQDDPTPTVSRSYASEGRGPWYERCAWNQDPIRSHGLLDVLELPLARIRESERQLAADVVVDRTGHEHAARLCQRLQPGRDINPVTVDPAFVVNHISQIDADAKQHATTFGDPLVALGHHGLELDRALSGTDDARKLSQDAVAGGVNDASDVPAYQRQDHALMRLDVPYGGGLIRVHEPAVASDIGGKNGGEPAADQGLLGHVSSAPVLHIALRIARAVLLDAAMETVRRDGA